MGKKHELSLEFLKHKLKLLQTILGNSNPDGPVAPKIKEMIQEVEVEIIRRDKGLN